MPQWYSGSKTCRVAGGYKKTDFSLSVIYMSYFDMSDYDKSYLCNVLKIYEVSFTSMKCPMNL